MSLTKFNPRIGENLLEIVSSIAELKSLKHFKHPVLVLGATDTQDGDGGIYLWDASNNEDNNDISIIESNGNGVGRWKRLSYAMNSSEDAPLTFNAPSSKNVSFRVDNYSIDNIESSFTVSATSNVDWITIGDITRDGLNHTINYSVSLNSDISSSRQGVITIKNGFNTFTYNVTQDAAEFVSASSALAYDNVARVGIITNITSNTSWTATTNTDWITILTAEGDGNSSIQFDIGENLNQFDDRYGKITVTTTSGYSTFDINITQSQGVSFIDNVDEQTHLSDEAAGLSFTVNSDIGWTATTNTDWITITTNSGTDGDAVVYSITENTDTENDRTGTIILTSANENNIISVTITQLKKIVQQGFEILIDTSLYSDSDEFKIFDARNITVDWGDGSTPSNSHETTPSDITHTYNASGEYTVSITRNSQDINDCNFRFGSTSTAGSHKMITEVLSWGDLKVESLEYFMAGCSNLTSVSSNFTLDTSSVTDMYYAWSDCTSLTGSFPLIDTSNVINMVRAWSNCSSLTGSFPLIDTSSVTDMHYAWYRCQKLTSFPLIDTRNVINMVRAWSNCSSLTGSFPLIDTSSVTDMTYTWAYCDSLTSFPLIDTSGVTNMNYTWHRCSSLTGPFPLIDTSSVTDMNSTWSYCTSLTGAFPAINTSSVTDMHATWHFCSSLTSFPSINTSGVTDLSVTWAYCRSLTGSFPLIDTSGVTDMRSAWYYCDSLTSFPLIDTSSVTDMERAWYHCTGLTAFPAINTSSVTDMTYTWAYCTSLTGAFPAINTSNVTNMNSTWYRCTSLTAFPSINIGSATSMIQTWSYCSALDSFGDFLNSTYTDALWDRTWRYAGKNNNSSPDGIAFTSASNPFTNIGPGETIGVRPNYYITISSSQGGYVSNIGLRDPLPFNSSYYPPFDISNVNAVSIEDNQYLTITGFNVTGWDAMTFPNVNLGGTNNYPNTTVEIDINALLPSSKVDDILNDLYTNLNNHTTVTGTNTYSANFHGHSSRTAASNTAYTGLINAGWTITGLI